MLVDAHCHLDFPQFDSDREQVIARAKDVVIVNSTVDPELVEKALGMGKLYENVYCALGFSASEVDEDRFGRMCALIREHRGQIVALGEVGLDYYWVKDDSGREAERRHFTEMALMSRELALPLVVHCREAEEDCINILKGLNLRAMMHCFSGSLEQARRAIDIGCLISIPANVVSSKSRQRLAQALPLESMVLETDAPYLSPVRGERNEPGNVREGAKKISQLLGAPLASVEEATTSNALGFFGIKW